MTFDSMNELTLKYEERIFRFLGLIVGGISAPLIEFMALTGKMPLHRGQPAGILDIIAGVLFGLPFVLVLVLSLFGSTGTTFDRQRRTYRRWWALLGWKVGQPQSLAAVRSICITKEIQLFTIYTIHERYVYVARLDETGPGFYWALTLEETDAQARKVAAFLQLPVTNLPEQFINSQLPRKTIHRTRLHGIGGCVTLLLMYFGSKLLFDKSFLDNIIHHHTDSAANTVVAPVRNQDVSPGNSTTTNPASRANRQSDQRAKSTDNLPDHQRYAPVSGLIDNWDGSTFKIRDDNRAWTFAVDDHTKILGTPDNGSFAKVWSWRKNNRLVAKKILIGGHHP
jgi:hypothetical protein